MNRSRILILSLITILFVLGIVVAQERSNPVVKVATLGDTRRVHSCGSL